MKSRIKEFFSGQKIRPDGTTSGTEELFGSLFFILISAILTVLNIVKHVNISMTIATSVLTVGFVISALLSYKRKLTASRVLIVILCGVIFSMFAIIGGNDGFAILWILLVPIVGSLWVGLKYGTILSGYFQLFIIALFYTPLSRFVDGLYSQTFMLRFPLLYFATFGSITFLMWQRKLLSQKLYEESYFDALTGLHNRRYYNELIEEIEKEGMNPGFTYFSFDLNRLKYANDTYGHQAGDELLQAAASIISDNFKDAHCFRTGGDEFVAFSDSIDIEQAVAGLKKDAAAWSGQFMPSISISVGCACADTDKGLSFNEIASLADERMYADKSQYYIRNDRRKPQ